MKYRCQYLSSILFVLFISCMFLVNLGEALDSFSDRPLTKRVTGKNTIWNAIDEEIKAIDKAKYIFININGLYDRLLGKKYVYDNVRSNDLMKDSNGRLRHMRKKPANLQTLDETLKNVEDSYSFLQEEGVDFLYVMVDPNDTYATIYGLHDYTKEMTDYYYLGLSQRDIPTFDCRPYIDAEEDYFKTDHHWKIETAFYISQQICNYFSKKNYHMDDRIYKGENHSIINLGKCFLGIEGRRVGVFYNGLDDYSYVVPNYNTDFKVDIFGRDGFHEQRDGDFRYSVMTNMKENNPYDFESSIYYTYWGGDYAEIEVTNKTAESDVRLLVLKDSVGIPVTAFLACNVSSMTIVDLRSDYDFNLESKVRYGRYDAVVFIYGNGYIDKTPNLFKIVSEEK